MEDMVEGRIRPETRIDEVLEGIGLGTGGHQTGLDLLVGKDGLLVGVGIGRELGDHRVQEVNLFEEGGVGLTARLVEAGGGGGEVTEDDILGSSLGAGGGDAGAEHVEEGVALDEDVGGEGILEEGLAGEGFLLGEDVEVAEQVDVLLVAEAGVGLGGSAEVKELLALHVTKEEFSVVPVAREEAALVVLEGGADDLVDALALVALVGDVPE